MNSPVQKIKERLSIEEVVSSYIKLEKSGSNFKARCPFHNEKTPSFFISSDRDSYYCFGCGAKGDIFTLVEEFEGLDFKGALKLLAQKAGVVLDNYNPKEESEKEKLYRIMEEATKFFENNLTQTPIGKEALDYLKSRGLEDKIIKGFRIGFIQNEWRDLLNYFQAKGFKENELEKAGLIKKVPEKNSYYDRFRNRIMFPISDSSGRVIAFSGRLFKDDLLINSEQQKSQPKYLNSPETPIFFKSAILYGLDKAKDSIRKNNFSILVEGQFDLILSHQAGFKNSVATSGTALSDSISKENVVSNLGLLRRLSSNIVLAFDADKAGLNASNRASKIALSFGMDVKVASLPDNTDPADLISLKGVNAWKEAIRNSKHIIEFLLNKILKDNGLDSQKLGREVKEKILPYVDSISSSIEKAFFIKKIHDLTQIPEEALREDLKKIEKESNLEKKEIKEVEESRSKIFKKDYIERRLWGIIFWQESLVKPLIDILKSKKEILEILNKKEEEIKLIWKDSLEDLIFEAEIFYGLNSNLENDFQELVLNLKEEYLREKLMRQMSFLKEYEEKKDIINANLILKEINQINKEIQDIKNGRFYKK